MRAILNLNVSDLAPHHAFWVDTLGGKSRGPNVIEFPMVRVMLKERVPTGGSKGTPVNHVAFGVPDIRAAVERTRAAGYPMITRAELPTLFEVKDDLAFIPPLSTSVAFTMGPDDIKVEFLEVRSATEMAFHHIHFFSPEPERMKLWYAALFGVEPADRGPFQAVDLPDGFNLSFSPAESVVPTAGRVLDRIGFERQDGAPFSGKTIVDPWGTSLELSEAS
jgi:catechol 2,3-dioxygenase-like lactoylglutathione lyase family enzyme